MLPLIINERIAKIELEMIGQRIKAIFEKDFFVSGTYAILLRRIYFILYWFLI